MTAAVSTELRAVPAERENGERRRSNYLAKAYPLWYYLPAGLLFLVFFAIPTFASFFLNALKASACSGDGSASSSGA